MTAGAHLGQCSLRLNMSVPAEHSLSLAHIKHIQLILGGARSSTLVHMPVNEGCSMLGKHCLTIDLAHERSCTLEFLTVHSAWMLTDQPLNE
jgi:hypothetical protein